MYYIGQSLVACQRVPFGDLFLSRASIARDGGAVGMRGQRGKSRSKRGRRRGST